MWCYNITTILFQPSGSLSTCCSATTSCKILKPLLRPSIYMGDSSPTQNSNSYRRNPSFYDVGNIGALMLRIGLWVYDTITRIRKTTNSIGNYVGPYITYRVLWVWKPCENLASAPVPMPHARSTSPTPVQGPTKGPCKRSDKGSLRGHAKGSLKEYDKGPFASRLSV